MAASAINQVPSPTATFPLPVTPHPGTCSCSGADLVSLQLSEQHIPSLAHTRMHLLPVCPAQLGLWSPAGVPVLGCAAGLMGPWCCCGMCCAPAAAGSPCLACSGGRLRDRTGGLEVTAWAKLFVLLSSCSPCLRPAPSAKPHHRIPLGTLVMLQLLQCHIPGCWGHPCHSGLLLPGEGVTAQGIQAAERAGDPPAALGQPGCGSPGCFHPSTAPLGCTPHSEVPPVCPTLLGYYGNVSSPTGANTSGHSL